MIGVPGASVDGAAGAGAVEVAYGNDPNRFDKRRQRLEPGDALGVPVEPGSGFGTALAHGWLDGDDFSDLAIGIPRLDAGTRGRRRSRSRAVRRPGRGR